MRGGGNFAAYKKAFAALGAGNGKRAGTNRKRSLAIAAI